MKSLAKTAHSLTPSSVKDHTLALDYSNLLIKLSFCVLQGKSSFDSRPGWSNAIALSFRLNFESGQFLLIFNV
jgi:hypothetical protein